jgi:hypothetical protein
MTAKETRELWTQVYVTAIHAFLRAQEEYIEDQDVPARAAELAKNVANEAVDQVEQAEREVGL